MLKRAIIITILLIGIVLPASFERANAGTVLSAHKYAWSNNVGYINFENVVVDDSSLTGYAWSENTGWIKFSPSRGGVYNDGNGHLSGFAWGEGLGWIDFSGTNISTTTGEFSGTATGDVVGTINFDCPNYCDVRTDWSPVATTTPATTTPPTSNTTGSRSGGSRLGSLVSGQSYVESNNIPLLVYPHQSGKISKDTSVGTVTVEIPVNNLAGRTIFIINEDKITAENNYLVPKGNNLAGGTFFDIYAIDENSLYVHNFAHAISVTLPLSDAQKGAKNLGLYWLNEKNWKWVLIPDAVFGKDNVTFTVNHLTKFAIFSSDAVAINGKSTVPNSIALPAGKRPIFDSEKIISDKKIASSTMIYFDEKKYVSMKNIGVLLVILMVIIAIFAVKRFHRANK